MKEVAVIEDRNKEEMKNMMSNFFVNKTNGEIKELKENIHSLNNECVKLYDKFQQEKYVF
jgi:polyhydroxyalkanoate synthesis regulator phasin